MEPALQIAPNHWFNVLPTGSRYCLTITLILLSGCTSMHVHTHGCGGGTTTYFGPPSSKSTTIAVRGKSHDEVWDATLAAVHKHLAVVEQDKDTGVIEAKEDTTGLQDTVQIQISPSAESQSYTIDLESPNGDSGASNQKVRVIAAEIVQTLRDTGTNHSASAQTDPPVEISETNEASNQSADGGEKQSDKRADSDSALTKVAKGLATAILLPPLIFLSFLAAY